MRSSSKRACDSLFAVALVAFLCLVPLARASAQQAQSTGEAAGIVFQTLSPQDLDTLKEKTGYRLGVMVVEVKPGSPGAAAGMKPRDVIFAVGKTGVDSAEGAVAAIKAASGVVELTAVTLVNDSYTPKVYSLDLGGGTPPGGGGAGLSQYRDPQGRFEFQHPGDWTTQDFPNGQGVSLSRGNASVTIMVFTGAPGAEQVLDSVGGQIQGQTKEYKELGRGQMRIGGQSAPAMEFTGVNPQGIRAHSQLAVLVAGGTAYVFLLSAAEEEFSAAQPLLQVVLTSFKVAGAGVVAPTTGPGWKLEALPKEALDQIEKSLGRRVGVSIVQVTSGSPADKAGLKAGDILLVVAKTPVDSSEKVEQALAGQSGSVEILAMRRAGDKFEPLQCTIVLAGGAGTTGPTGPMPPVSNDPVTAYFDMMDFIRTQAWGRTVSTSAAERQRVAALLQESLGELDPQTRQAIEEIPEVWAALQKAWGQAPESERAQHREKWRKYLLTPGQLLPPPEAEETFRAEGDQVVFKYPPRWIVAQTKTEDMALAYLGPPGLSSETTWEQIIDPAKTPPGALFVVATIDEELKASGSHLEAARIIARNLVTAIAPDMKEIDALELGNDGAIITLMGRVPGQKEDWFFWVGCTRFSAGEFFAGRLGGPVSQAETLIPAFDYMIGTMELRPPGGGGEGDYNSLMVEYYAAKAGNIAVSGGW